MWPPILASWPTLSLNIHWLLDSYEIKIIYFIFVPLSLQYRYPTVSTDRPSSIEWQFIKTLNCSATDRHTRKYSQYWKPSWASCLFEYSISCPVLPCYYSLDFPSLRSRSSELLYYRNRPPGGCQERVSCSPQEPFITANIIIVWLRQGRGERERGGGGGSKGGRPRPERWQAGLSRSGWLAGRPPKPNRNRLSLECMNSG